MWNSRSQMEQPLVSKQYRLGANCEQINYRNVGGGGIIIIIMCLGSNNRKRMQACLPCLVYLHTIHWT